MRRSYIPQKRFTQEQFEKALAVPLLPFLENRGYEFRRKGLEVCMKNHDSFVVSNNLWCWHSRHMGGNVFSFLTKVENMRDVDAVLLLCGEDVEQNHYQAHIQNEKMKIRTAELVLPPANKDARRVFAYLMKSRGIDSEIISAMMHEGLIYESREYIATVKTANEAYTKIKVMDSDSFVRLTYNNVIVDTREFENGIVIGYSSENKPRYAGIDNTEESTIMKLTSEKKLQDVGEIHNCVFIGKDEDETPRFASVRSITTGSHFRQDAIGSDKQYGFHMNGVSDKVYVFEAPIDAMSHATLFKICKMDWKQDSRVSLGGISELSLDRFLETRKDIKQITLCLDNDRAGRDNIYGRYNEEKGRQEIRSLLQKYSDSGYDVQVSLSATKDYNSDLLAYLNPIVSENNSNEEDMEM